MLRSSYIQVRYCSLYIIIHYDFEEEFVVHSKREYCRSCYRTKVEGDLVNHSRLK